MRNHSFAVALAVAAQALASACTETVVADTPNPPSDISATLTGPTTVKLMWTARPRSERITSYVIYRNGTMIGGSEENSFIDANLDETTTLSYTVSARNEFDQESPRSSPVSIKTGDGTAPRIMQSFPANISGPLPVANIKMLLVFSEAMDSASMSAANIAVTSSSGQPIPVGIGYFRSLQAAQITPLQQLAGGVTITVTAGTGVKDAAGNALASPYTYSFATAERVPPTVIATDPVNGATGVSLAPEIHITFSERMKPDFFDIFLHEAATGYIPTLKSYDTVTNVLTMIPRERLLSNRRYVVSSGFNFPPTDLADNPLVAFAFSFTTLDAGAPTVVAITPANNATDIDPGTAVKITFSEAMDASTFNSSTVRFYKFDGTGTLSAGLSYESDSHVLTITPGTTLEPATKYVVALTLQITDATGIPMEAFYSATFTTR